MEELASLIEEFPVRLEHRSSADQVPHIGTCNRMVHCSEESLEIPLTRCAFLRLLSRMFANAGSDCIHRFHRELRRSIDAQSLEDALMDELACCLVKHARALSRLPGELSERRGTAGEQVSQHQDLRLREAALLEEPADVIGDGEHGNGNYT